MQKQQFFSVLTGFAGLGVLWIVLLIATKKHPWALAIGEDGRPSTSKLQMLMWTAAVVFAFLAIFQIRYSAGFTDQLPDVPTNLLIAMGISVTTAVAAKSIAVNSSNGTSAPNNAPAPAPPPPAAQVAAVPAGNAPAVANPPAPVASATPAPSKSGIFAGDDGNPDLGKVQLMLWTLIAVGIFLSQVWFAIAHPTCPPAGGPCTQSLDALKLPDIGTTLMILMGLGHGAYIGKKIAES